MGMKVENIDCHSKTRARVCLPSPFVLSKSLFSSDVTASSHIIFFPLNKMSLVITVIL